MSDFKHTVLCVDDEKNILNSLKRLLRKEGYNLLTASSGPEGLKILEQSDVHLVICDQRMPGMSGTDFLASVKEKYPDAIRIVLTGYTEVDAITESVNKGHIYKFFLKPWNDQSLKLEIRQALEQYDLVQANKSLNKRVLEQNEELKRINENLEELVRQRTEDLDIQNQVLELSRAMLDDLPVPIIGVSAEGMIAVTNQQTQGLSGNGRAVQIGGLLSDYFSSDLEQQVTSALETDEAKTVEEERFCHGSYRVHVAPLSGRFRGRGVVMTLTPAG
ncbi:MAG: response regulator [Thermodesulfobacteriota bacterium]|nr:response regulator [Thermodesulfobacteriota bacterium]